MQRSETRSGHRSRLPRLLAVVGLIGGLLAATASPAAADPANGGSASAYGVTIDPLIPPTPEVSATYDGDDADDTTVDIPADPLAVSGTASTSASVHTEADLDSVLEVNSQDVDGPYNARAVGTLESAEVLGGVEELGVSLLSADAVRAEAVAVCTGDTVSYAANSEVVNLDLAGTDIPLNGPLETLLGQVSDLIDTTMLSQVVDVEYNVVTESADGIAVDALVVSVLDAADTPLSIRIGHAELSGVSCGAADDIPECSDTVDNDGDGVIDADDPECHTDGDPDNPDSYDPDDDDEGDDGGDEGPACADGIDNDGDGVIDADDPGCHTDGDPTNPDSFDPTDTDEADPAGTGGTGGTGDAGLPRTGGDVPLAAAVFTAIAALGALNVARLRRAR